MAHYPLVFQTQCCVIFLINCKLKKTINMYKKKILELNDIFKFYFSKKKTFLDDQMTDKPMSK